MKKMNQNSLDNKRVSGASEGHVERPVAECKIEHIRQTESVLQR